ncbi:MAG: hypothetical protein H0U62_06855 [Actinobacteria bacterium]|nr:hypothetical protein [Actinomycetota bacterium]
MVTKPESATELAARRRATRNPTPTPMAAGASPAPVAATVPNRVVASRTLVAAHVGAGGPAAPTGGVFAGRPAILEPMPATAAALPQDADYVTAACDAEESMVPPGCYTPVTRLLWHKGYRVRRDLYDAVLAEHALNTAAGAPTTAAPAGLPPGVTDVPATMLVNRVDPVIPGAPVQP